VTTRRVAITGVGAVSAAGENAEALWRSILAPRSHLSPSARRDLAPFAVFPVGEMRFVTGATAAERIASAALSAATEAAAAARLERADFGEAGAGVVFGTCLGAWDAVADPFSWPARRIAERFGLRGGTSTVSTACSSGAGAVAEACARILGGASDVMLAGGGDVLTPFVVSGFAALQALTATAVRPFDRRRDGLALGEGAGMLVLEELEHARRRGAPIAAEILGWGLAADAHHMTSPDPRGEGLASAARRALQDRDPGAIGFVNAHGTGTVLNDRAEAIAVRAVLGSGAGKVPTNAIKPVMGHTLGAAGALEAIVCARALQEQIVPPTLGFEEPDADCGGLLISGRLPAERRLSTALSLSSGFGGQNVALMLGAP
jgi:3-oxoacyl-[acyl-carrier-protein] synthase II